MKKVLALVMAVTLALLMVVCFTGCGGKKDTETTAAETTAATEQSDTTQEETTAAANGPKAGETLNFGGAKVTIPEGWVTEAYEEGKKVELHPKADSFEYVEINLHDVYDNNHAKEWAKNIDENYGGGNKIDEVTIGGKTFYRVNADPEQNVCFADIDDKSYIKVAVMFMPWENAEAALSAISFS